MYFQVCSADTFFTTEEGEYLFDASQLKAAHEQSQAAARAACEASTNVVIVDNTGVRRWELVAYFKLAQAHNYSVILVEPRTPWKLDVKELATRNSHGVDR